jgi:hypothetical protein
MTRDYRQIVEVPPEEAAIIVELIDHNQAIAHELPQLYRGVAAAFEELGMPLGIPEPRVPTFVVRRGLEELRKKYARLAGEVAEPTREELGGDVAMLRTVRDDDTATVASIAGELGVTQEYAELWLHDLQFDELVRELKDGRGNLTWEVTSRGDDAL